MRRETTEEGGVRKGGHQLAGLQGGRGDGNDGGERRRVEGGGEETGEERGRIASSKVGKKPRKGLCLVLARASRRAQAPGLLVPSHSVAR